MLNSRDDYDANMQIELKEKGFRYFWFISYIYLFWLNLCL